MNNPADMDETWPRLGDSGKGKKKQITNSTASPGLQLSLTTSPTPAQGVTSWSAIVAGSRRVSDRPPQQSPAPSTTTQISNSTARRISLPLSSQANSPQSTAQTANTPCPPAQDKPILLKNGNVISPPDATDLVDYGFPSTAASPALTEDSFVTNPFDPDHVKSQTEKNLKESRNSCDGGAFLASGAKSQKHASAPHPRETDMDGELGPSEVRRDQGDVSETASMGTTTSFNTTSAASNQEWTAPSATNTKLPGSTDPGQHYKNGQAESSHKSENANSHTTPKASTPPPPTPRVPIELLPTPILVQYNYGIQFSYATHSAVIGLYIPPYPPSSPSSRLFQPVTCRHLITEIERKANYPSQHRRSVTRLRSVHVIWQSRADSLNWAAPTTIVDTLPRSVARRPGSYSMELGLNYADPDFYYHNSTAQEYPLNEDGSRQWGSGLVGRQGVRRFNESVDGNGSGYGYDTFNNPRTARTQPSVNGNGNNSTNQRQEKDEKPFEAYNGATNSPSKWAKRGFEKSTVPTGKWADLTTLCNEELWNTLRLMGVRGWKAHLVVQFEFEDSPSY